MKIKSGSGYHYTIIPSRNWSFLVNSWWGPDTSIRQGREATDQMLCYL